MATTAPINVTLNPVVSAAGLNQAQRQIQQALGRITGQASEFQKSLDASTARVFAFGATTSVLAAITLGFKALISSTIDVEKRLVEINSIFGATAREFDKFRTSIFEVAKNTGQSFAIAADGAAELARQGLSAAESTKRLEAALVLSRISGMDSVASVKSLTAAINGFTSEALTAVQITNKLVAVDTAFAVSSDDLAQAFSRAGSTAEDAGVSFDELLGLVTAVEQKTARGGAVIGNAFKSIFTRLQRGKTIDDLKELGVQIDSTQTGVQKLQALSNALENISDPTTASAIKELAGGVFQINVVSAALKDLGSETSIFAQAAGVASKAANEAYEKNAKLNETISSQINSLVVGLTTLAERIGTITFGPLLKNLLGLANKLSGFLDKALDPEKGNVFIQGLFKAIGAFLSGPGLIIFTTAFFKIFSLVAKFARDGLKSLFEIGSQTEKIKSVERGLVDLLGRNANLRSVIQSTTTTQAQKEQAIIAAIKQENALLAQQEAILRRLATVAVGKGVTGTNSAGGFSGKGGKRFAAGYMAEEATAKMLGASSGVKAKMGKGTIGGQKFIMNNQEIEIPNFGRNGDSAVIPMYAKGFVPKSASPKKTDRRNTTTDAKGKIVNIGDLPLALDANSLAPKGLGLLGLLDSEGLTTGSIAVSKIGAFPDVGNSKEQIGLTNIKKAGLIHGIDNTSKEGSFRGYVRDTMGPAMVNLSKKIFSEIFSDNEQAEAFRAIEGSPKGQLFSTTAEGDIIERATQIATTKANEMNSMLAGNEQTPFDFAESGTASSKFSDKVFGDVGGVSKADAKRTIDSKSTASLVKKVFLDSYTKKQAFSQLGGKIAPLFNKIANVPIGKNLSAMLGGSTSIASMITKAKSGGSFDLSHLLELDSLADQGKLFQNNGILNTAGGDFGVPKGSKQISRMSLVTAKASRGRAAGFIPNFNSMNQGVPVSQIRAHFDSAGNPIAVTNTRDEPNGLKDAIGREKKGIGMAAAGFVPNFAKSGGGGGGINLNAFLLLYPVLTTLQAKMEMSAISQENLAEGAKKTEESFLSLSSVLNTTISAVSLLGTVSMFGGGSIKDIAGKLKGFGSILASLGTEKGKIGQKLSKFGVGDAGQKLISEQRAQYIGSSKRYNQAAQGKGKFKGVSNSFRTASMNKEKLLIDKSKSALIGSQIGQSMGKVFLGPLSTTLATGVGLLTTALGVGAAAFAGYKIGTAASDTEGGVSFTNFINDKIMKPALSNEGLTGKTLNVLSGGLFRGIGAIGEQFGADYGGENDYQTSQQILNELNEQTAREASSGGYNAILKERGDFKRATGSTREDLSGMGSNKLLGEYDKNLEEYAKIRDENLNSKNVTEQEAKAEIEAYNKLISSLESYAETIDKSSQIQAEIESVQRQIVFASSKYSEALATVTSSMSNRDAIMDAVGNYNPSGKFADGVKDKMLIGKQTSDISRATVGMASAAGSGVVGMDILKQIGRVATTGKDQFGQNETLDGLISKINEKVDTKQSGYENVDPSALVAAANDWRSSILDAGVTWNNAVSESNEKIKASTAAIEQAFASFMDNLSGNAAKVNDLDQVNFKNLNKDMQAVKDAAAKGDYKRANNIMEGMGPAVSILKEAGFDTNQMIQDETGLSAEKLMKIQGLAGKQILEDNGASRSQIEKYGQNLGGPETKIVNEEKQRLEALNIELEKAEKTLAAWTAQFGKYTFVKEAERVMKSMEAAANSAEKFETFTSDMGLLQDTTKDNIKSLTKKMIDLQDQIAKLDKLNG
jgi:TP901 family phage tail tape measure protein